MTITAREGHEAAESLQWIADHWTDLRARLRPGGGNALTGMPGGDGSEASPIDLGISDLMREIEDEARSLGHVLLDETADWAPRSSRMPVLLYDVAERYGHWTAGDERTALAFCDWAEEYRDKVCRALERPAPASYVGPCQGKGDDGAGCGGELHVRDGRTSGTCHECGRRFTLDEQRAFIERELSTRLMTVSELVTALVVLGTPVPLKTIRSWVQRKRLIAAVPGESLYRLNDAKELAELGSRHTGREAVRA